jgi:hypothetical protein
MHFNTTPIFIIIIIIIFSTILYLFMHNEINNCNTYVDHIYFGTITVATIGYGDMYPKTQKTKIFITIYLLLVYYIIFYELRNFK